jgi:hypothetical protein
MVGGIFKGLTRGGKRGGKKGGGGNRVTVPPKRTLSPAVAAKKIIKKRTPSPLNKQDPKQGEHQTAQEGARHDPDTGGSVDAAREVGTKGEKVTIGKLTSNNFLRDMASAGSRARAKAMADIDKELQTATGKNKKNLLNARDKLDAADKAAFNKQQGKNRSHKDEMIRRKYSKKKEPDGYAALLETGEIISGFKPTKNQVQKAISNLKQRGKTDVARQLEAKFELGSKKYKAQKVKEAKNMREGSGKRTPSRGHTPRAEERKRGGKVTYRAGGDLVSKKKTMYGYKEGGQV